MAEKKFFVDINLQGNKLVNPVVGSNGSMTTAGSFQYNAGRLEYYNGSTVQEVANLNDIAAVTGGLILQGGYDAATNTPDIAADSSVLKGFFWVVTAAGSFLGEAVQVGDSIIAKQDNPGATAANWLILQGNVVIATDSVDGISRLATQAEADAGTEGGAVVITPATLQGKIDAQITPEINNKLPLAGGTMTGTINMNGNAINNISDITVGVISNVGSDPIEFYNIINANNGITNLGAPTNGSDAANKTYVDDNTSNKLPLSGGTMSGAINIDGNDLSNVGSFDVVAGGLVDMNGAAVNNVATPVSGHQATNKTYVDDAALTAQTNAISDANTYTNAEVATRLPLAGGTMLGGIDMNNNSVYNSNYIQGTEVSASTLYGTNLDSYAGTVINLKTELNASLGTITNLLAPTNGGDAANKDYVDGAASTAQSNAQAYADSLAPNYDPAGSAATAESNANDYTDTEIAATRYSANIQTTDWTVFGGDPANGYIATITHNLNCYYPVIQLNDDNTGYAVEMATQYNNLNETNIFSNFIPSGLIVATLIKAAV